MYFSRITLPQNAGENQAFWRLGGEYSIHQAVWNLFGDHADRRRDFLYRIESVGRFPLIYAVSARKPVDSTSLWNLEIKDFNPQITNGMRLGFQLRANPTIKRQGKRHDVVMNRKKNEIQDMTKSEIVQNTCGKWLDSRSSINGFRVECLRVDGYIQHRLLKKKDVTEVRYSSVDFTGTISIVDANLFKNMLFNGAGPEKGFGCGLMLVKII